MKKRSLKRNRQARGAALVESLIIISSFVFFFLCMTFFRTFYLNQIVSARFARGATLMYSMAGCDKVDVKQWLDLAKEKRDKYSTNFPGKSSGTVAVGGTNTASTETQGTQDKIGAGNGSFANPIMAGEVIATAWAGTKGGLVGGGKKVFKQTIKSRSFVTCGDVPRDDDFESVLAYVKDAFGGKMGGS